MKGNRGGGRRLSALSDPGLGGRGEGQLAELEDSCSCRCWGPPERGCGLQKGTTAATNAGRQQWSLTSSPSLPPLSRRGLRPSSSREPNWKPEGKEAPRLSP